MVDNLGSKNGGKSNQLQTVSDPNNDITYNRLNLPECVDVNNGKKVFYHYDGYKLKTVEDTGEKTDGFADGASTSTEYSYHVNASLDEDKNKGINSVLYSILNLPTTVSTTENRKVEYTYTASGAKLHKIATKDQEVVDEKYYLGGFEYNGTGLLGHMHQNEIFFFSTFFIK